MNARKVHSTAEKVQGVKIMWEAIPVFLSVCLVSNITEFCVPVWMWMNVAEDLPIAQLMKSVRTPMEASAVVADKDSDKTIMGNVSILMSVEKD